MDGLLLLHPIETAIGYAGPGDFLLGEDGRLARRGVGGRAPFLFAGIQILHSRLFVAIVCWPRRHPLGGLARLRRRSSPRAQPAACRRPPTY